MLEQDIIQFIGGNGPSDMQKFPERLPGACQNYHRLEFYESDEENEEDGKLKTHEKSWNVLDGMTSAINT